MGRVLLTSSFSLGMLRQRESIIRVRRLGLDEALEVLKGGFESFVGHEATAQLLSSLIGAQVKANRAPLYLSPGDTLVVFQILERLPEGKVLSREEVEAMYSGGRAAFYLVKLIQPGQGGL